MFKRPRLIHALLLCSTLAVPACGGGNGEKDESSDGKDDDGKDDDGKDSDGKDSDSSDGKDSDSSDGKDSDGSDETTDKDTDGGDSTSEKEDPLVEARAVFVKECGCHGKNGETEASNKAKKFNSDEAKDWTDDYITGVIEDGKGSGMPKFKGNDSADDDLTDDQIKSLLDLIRCFQKESDPADCGKS